MKFYKKDLLKVICKFSERELQSKIIEPLLEAQGFNHVKDVSGSIEKGRDLVALKEDFGRTKLYVIQIKKLKLTEKSQSTKSLTYALTQLFQAANEEIPDPSTNICRRPDRTLFISPYPIPYPAINSAITTIQDLQRYDITIIDGPILLSEILKYSPELLHQLSFEMHYRIRFQKFTNVIREAAAFERKGRLFLDDLFVSPSLGHNTIGFHYAANQSLPSRGDLIIQTSKCYLAEFISVIKNWGIDPPRWVKRQKDTKNAIDRYKKEGSSGPEPIVIKINLDKMCSTIHRRIRSILKRVSSESVSDTTISRSTKVLRELHSCSKLYTPLQSLSIIDKHCPSLIRRTSIAIQLDTIAPIQAKILLRTKYNLFITGSPGVGKSTLLRKLANNVARTCPEDLPILVDLVHVKSGKKEEIFDYDKGLQQVHLKHL